MAKPKILFISGSARKDSYNKKLAKVATQIASENGAIATFIDLKDYPIPIYDGDYEEANSLPQTAIDLKMMFIDHDAFFIASPEYNGSFTPLLKNTLDWISRPHTEGEVGCAAYNNKVAAISAASPGGYGGLRGLVPLRMMLGNIGVHVIPEQLAIPFYSKSFNENGTLNDPKTHSMLKGVIIKLIETTKALNS